MRVSVVALLVATTLSSVACHTMRPVTFGDLGAMQPKEIWVTRADQSVVVVSGPRTFGDTLVGYVNGRFEEMPATGLQRMMVRRPARGKTAALLAVSLVGVGALAALVAGVGDFKNPEDKLDCEDDPYQPGCPLGPPLP